ncbi:hypothetical protein AB0I91_40055 [Actinosynnema sp. NPDC049800]
MVTRSALLIWPGQVEEALLSSFSATPASAGGFVEHRASGSRRAPWSGGWRIECDDAPAGWRSGDR